ncbi:helix-turn-helix domain-containing protein [Bacillus paralicheniformis]|uniref:Crp/Fnr family transcriptional regulator n=1 Tax=Bacillus paralicheniformis TaxID=1648923 RepID=UPI0030DB82B4
MRPEFARAFTNEFFRSFRHCLHFMDPEIRIAYMILELGNKYGKPVQGAQDRIKIELPLSREELANYVGVTRETISRKFSKFERLGIIEIKGTREITILNLQKLNEYID